MIADIADGAALAAEIAAAHGANCGRQHDLRRQRRGAGRGARRRHHGALRQASTSWSTTRRCSHRCRRPNCTEIDVALWDRVMAVNLRGPFLMVKHVVPHMKAQGYGKIINIGSGTVYRGIPLMLHYVTSKGGGDGLHPRAVARARRARHPRQHAGARLHAQRHGAGREQSGPRRQRARPTPSPRRALKRDAASARTCSARWSSWPRPTAISSPGRPSRSTAAR